jgi:DNA helicase-2/ATP-dependent DNA helicase PcrA
VLLTLDVLFTQAGFAPNESQRRAIEHVDGPLFLVAGPGSGKTRVLLWRVVNLVVFHGVAPDQIFLSTFTEKAAKQLQDGLITLLALATQHTGVPYDLSGMYVGTVHSLCARLLRDRALTPGRERAPAPAVLDALDQYFELASGRFWREAVAVLGFNGELAELRKELSGLLGAEKPSASKHKVVVQLQALFNRLSEEDIAPDVAPAKGDPAHSPLFALYALYYRARLGDRRVDLSLVSNGPSLAYSGLLAPCATVTSGAP